MHLSPGTPICTCPPFTFLVESFASVQVPERLQLLSGVVAHLAVVGL
jgi:hypothetical protein